MSFTRKYYITNRSISHTVINKSKKIFPLKRLDYLRHLSFVALLSLLIFSCSKELTPIGIGLIEDQDLLSMGYTDTVQLVAYTVPDDSIYTRNLSFNQAQYIQIGSMYDPVFGTTTSNLYSQLFLTSNRTRFGTSPVFDSAFLYLKYKSSYGDTLSNMTFRVYSLTDDIVDSLTSRSYNTVSYDPDPIGEITFQPRPHDSAYYGGAKHSPTLRIPINRKFGNTVLGIADTNALNKNSAFIKAFKGICIIAEPQKTPGKGSIITFQISSDYLPLTMHYHNTPDSAKTYNFAISAGGSRFQNYNHNGHAEAIPMLKQQLDGNTILGKQFLFAQGLGGTKIKILFPYLDKWINNNKIVINDAQLVIGNSSVSSLFPNPGSLSLNGVGENGSTNPNSIVDANEPSGYFDGTYNSSANSYRFRITRYVQQVILGKERNTGLHLIIPSSAINPSRLILNGTSSPQSDMKLYLRYTKLP